MGPALATGTGAFLPWRLQSPLFRPGAAMQYLHTMIRVFDLDAALTFFCDQLGLQEIRRYDNQNRRF